MEAKKKKCTHCKKQKDANTKNFVRSIIATDGLCSWCRDCERELTNERHRRLREERQRF